MTANTQQTPAKITGILIDPIEGTARAVQLDPGDYKQIPQHLGCELFDVVNLSSDGRLSLYVDDEGRMVQPNPLGYFGFCHPNDPDTIMGEPFCGRGLILGCDPETGESTSVPPAMLPQIIARLRVIEDPDPETIQPRMTVHSIQ